MARSLTDAVIQNLKPERGQKGWREVADGGSRGLCLRISPSGEKAWGLRAIIAGRRQRHILGGYPAVSLAEARERARQYLSAARDGTRPEEIDAQRKAASMTISDAHTDYIEAMGDTLRPHTKRLKKDMFAHHIKPVLGDRLVASIRKSDIVELAEAVTAKKFYTQANRVYSEIMALLRWCEQLYRWRAGDQAAGYTQGRCGQGKVARAHADRQRNRHSLESCRWNGRSDT